MLRIVGVSRSTYYYQKHYRVEEKTVSEGRPAPGFSLQADGTKISDEQIKEWLLQLMEHEGAAYGYQKLTILLRRYFDLTINKKKVYRLCKELGILRPQREKKTFYPRKIARNRTITDSNQLWETDLKYGYIHGAQRFFFILSYIDVYDRMIVGFHIGLRCEGKDAVQTLNRALFKRQQYAHTEKPVIRSDNGTQFTSKAFANACEALGMEHERIPPRTPNMNAHIEAFHRILEDECLSRHEFQSYEEAYQAVTTFMQFYNTKRIHSSIGYLAPADFYKRKQLGEVTTKEVRL
ncbi:IS3 family transposase [Marinicrinis sediminis]|uniref:IS3 family transposase n=1 Tax=Marinicrinis sediminis TaxID=1652465 RepID=A0ABW5RB06_9BACL